MDRKDFLKRNQGFVCRKCGTVNPPVLTSERNHCFCCFNSLHVDLKIPGDRKSSCRALMEPERFDYRGNKGFMILHRCVKVQEGDVE